MGTREFHECVIIGAGPAGLGAALYASRAGIEACVLEKLSPGGQVLTTDWVDNYLGFEQGIAGYELIEHMKAHADRFGASFLSKEVSTIRGDANQGFDLHLATNEIINTRAVIVATGARPKQLNCPGEQELTGKGVSYCATCDGPFFKDMDIAVVGGGDSACQEALFLTKFAKRIFLVHRRRELRAVKTLQDKVLEHPKIEPIWDSIVESIGGENEVEYCMLKNVHTGEVRELKVKGVFIFIGIHPNTELVRGLVDLDDQGFIVTNEWMETNVPGIFAAGDCRSKPLRQIITAVSDGATAAYGVKHRLL